MTALLALLVLGAPALPDAPGAAPDVPAVELARPLTSGPEPGGRPGHLRVKAAVGPNVWCLMCDHGHANRLFIFITKLDEPAQHLLRSLADRQAELAKQYDVTTAVVWVGGDKEQLSRWAAAEGITELWLTVSVYQGDHKAMSRWQLNPGVANTAVLLSGDGRNQPLASLVNLEPDDERLEAQLQKHFKKRQSRSAPEMPPARESSP